MRGDTLVTGGSDGSVRIWSLEKMYAIHRLAAHDNSVTSLQFDDNRVVSGGSDGRVKIWDLKTGQLVRELLAQGEAVWRVAFEDEKCVALAQRQGRTVMEVSPPTSYHCMWCLCLETMWLTTAWQVWSFSAPEEVEYDSHLSLQQRQLIDSPERPLSAQAVDYLRARPPLEVDDDHDDDDDDIVMADEGPSTAPPLEAGPPPFFSNTEEDAR